MKIMPWVAFALALAIAYALTPWVRTLAFKYRAVAIPRDRDVHKEPLPRWGGLAMVGAFLLTLGLVYVYIATHRHVFPWNGHQLRQFEGVLIAATLVALIGTLDDKFEMSAAWQSLGLIAAGIVLVSFGVRIEGITNPFAHASVPPPRHGYDPATWLPLPAWFSSVATVVWVFGVAKTVDFLDGLDGLAAGVCAIIAAALVGGCLGFLRYNYNPATIIMGTVGAQFLGFVLAAIAIIGTVKIPMAISVALPVLVLGVPIFDGIRVVTQRTINRTPAYLPDKSSHIHHVLINRGLSQKRAVWVIYALTAGLCAVALLLFHVAEH